MTSVCSHGICKTLAFRSTDVISELNVVRCVFRRLVKRRLWTQYGCSWWRHQMKTFSELRAICAGNSPVPGEFPAQKPVTRSFDVFFDLRPNKRLSKQSWGWWFETLSCSLWRHCNVFRLFYFCLLMWAFHVLLHLHHYYYILIQW